ncbi:hypothetical protein Tco_0730377 [Tanacetum coccineum]|uniref:Xylulose kinase-1 n=1 Tax=Tanacetum coccineum TaxID=301880 RepID=A0ABQ4YSP4_9ASTR
MADLQFVDQHNMVACLERSDENAEFHQIVDFLTTSSIHYALTVSPTIYASYIEQFWATAKSKIVNDVKQIHATVDGKTVVISESSVRSDLHFNDEDVTTVATQHQKTHKPRRAKRGRDTEIPRSSGPPKKVGDEAVYTGEDDIVVRAATTASSLEAEQESGNIHKTRPTTTLNEPSPQGLGSCSRPRRQDTTLGGADAQTRFETASKKSHDPPLSKDNTFGSGEDILALENSKTAQDLVIQKLKKRVKRLEKALRARTLGMKLFNIGTSRRKGLDNKNVSKQERKSDKTKPMFNDSDFDVLDDAMENVEGGSTAKQITTAGDTLNTDSINVSTAGPSHVSIAGPLNVAFDLLPWTISAVLDYLNFPKFPPSTMAVLMGLLRVFKSPCGMGKVMFLSGGNSKRGDNERDDEQGFWRERVVLFVWLKVWWDLT